jgi:DNA-binding GntR family transcriptional regulator
MSAKQRVVRIIRDRIMSGEYQPGRRIPSQSEMADELGVPSRAVGLAIADLRASGYLSTLPHKGSYTRPPECWPESTA